MLGGVGAAALLSGGAMAGLTHENKKKSEMKKRWAMGIDLRRCYGCKSCMLSCKSEHNILLGVFRSWVNYVETGSYPRVERYFVPVLCNHCDDAPCIKVCPVGASYKREDGIVDIDKDRCIGCRYCMTACPYGMRYFVWKRRPHDGMDWPARRYGVAEKCDFCKHRIDNGLVPACVNTCPSEARIFGDLNDPDSDVSKAIASGKAQRLALELGTSPHVFYIGLDSEVAHIVLETGSRMGAIKK